jgi:hypothetical protein
MTAVGQWSAEASARTTTPVVGDWQLPAGHFEPSHIQPRIIAPRPDVERTYASRYSWAYPGLEYAVPIVVLGGKDDVFHPCPLGSPNDPIRVKFHRVEAFVVLVILGVRNRGMAGMIVWVAHSGPADLHAAHA